jgi:transposase
MWNISFRDRLSKRCFFMQGWAQEAGGKLYLFSLEDRIPKDHILRKIRKCIDEKKIQKAASRYYSEKGRPSVPPEMVVKILLLGCIYNEKSIRSLMNRISFDLSFLWFLGLDIDSPVPDHSTISRAQKRLGADFFNEIITETLLKCREAGLIDGEKLFVDSTYMEANASDASVVERGSNIVDYEVERKRILDKVKSYLTGVSGEAKMIEREKKEETVKDLGVKVEAKGDGEPEDSGGGGAESGKVAKSKKMTVNEKLVSKTAPEAAIISRFGKGLGLKYKLHVGADGGESRIITGFALTSGATSDESMFEELLGACMFAGGKKVREVGADTKYGTGRNLKMLSDMGIRAGMPYRGGDMEKRDFKYDHERDCYICPKGEDLTYRYIEKSDERKVYQCKGEICRLCGSFGKCTKVKKGRSVKVTIYRDVAEEAIAYGKTPAGKGTKRERSAIIEGANAQLKKDLGLARARSRDFKKVYIQCCIGVAAYNILKLVKKSDKDRREANVQRNVLHIVEPEKFRNPINLFPFPESSRAGLPSEKIGSLIKNGGTIKIEVKICLN